MGGHPKRLAQLSKREYGIQSIDRMVKIMQLLADSTIPLGLREITDGVELDKHTVYRYLICLTRHKMLFRTVAGRYVCNEQLIDFFLSD